ncbi:DUF3168 domain-containing protein [Segnochrobactrum spirostomi]|uniref:DUF3168 domain-containing protein n=1 Tax=Segnochrobactrum spirostomi TaxID=2608987 RepID=A0A6A7Y0D1_9HYPH|nr:DUF3168 domain-containing protein [Segnochrobactrum spirostomi]MQT12323.1 DUF3168 domain-containing protein [Segnochrobactrum spirostomi]
MTDAAIDAGFALQAAVHAALAADADLGALVPLGRLYDAPVRGAEHPFVAFGSWRTTVLDADEAPVRAHVFTLAVRSRAGGRKEAQAIAGRIEAVLHTASLPLDGHRLVNLTLVERTSAEGRDRRSFEADLTFRALTEPAA